MCVGGVGDVTCVCVEGRVWRGEAFLSTCTFELCVLDIYHGFSVVINSPHSMISNSSATRIHDRRES